MPPQKETEQTCQTLKANQPTNQPKESDYHAFHRQQDELKYTCILKNHNKKMYLTEVLWYCFRRRSSFKGQFKLLSQLALHLMCLKHKLASYSTASATRRELHVPFTHHTSEKCIRPQFKFPLDMHTHTHSVSHMCTSAGIFQAREAYLLTKISQVHNAASPFFHQKRRPTNITFTAKRLGQICLSV